MPGFCGAIFEYLTGSSTPVQEGGGGWPGSIGTWETKVAQAGAESVQIVI